MNEKIKILKEKEEKLLQERTKTRAIKCYNDIESAFNQIDKLGEIQQELIEIRCKIHNIPYYKEIQRISYLSSPNGSLYKVPVFADPKKIQIDIKSFSKTNGTINIDFS